MGVLIGLLIGGVVGWFARDLVPIARAAMERRGTTEAPAIHTVKGDDNWEVRRDGTDAPLATFPTKAEAQSAGRDRAKQDGAQHVVHRADDTVGESHDYSAER